MWLDNFKSWHLSQERINSIQTLFKGLTHSLNRFLTASQSFDSCILSRCCRVRCCLTCNLTHRSYNLRLTNCIANPPACHGVALRDTIDDHRLLANLLRQTGNWRKFITVINQTSIDVICQNQNIMLHSPVPNRPQLIRCINHTRRIGRRVQNQNLGLISTSSF